MWSMRSERPGAFVVEAMSDLPPLRLFLLKTFDARAFDGVPWVLPYQVDAVTTSGFRLETSDAVHRPPWNSGWRRRWIRKLERAGVPFLQTVLARRRIADSDAVVAMFESQGNALALLRRLGARSLRRPRMAMVVCWLAGDLDGYGRVRRAVVRAAYGSVDRVFYFSSNQRAIFERELGVPRDRLTFIPFGIDHYYFAPHTPAIDEGYLLAVGRDRGRDWRTLFDAVRGSSIRLKVACRMPDLDGLDIPDNVETLGVVPQSEYRRLLAGATAVAVITHERAYPTGQTVALEAMSMAKCCVVTSTRPMEDYLQDGVNAVLVPEGDSLRLRETLLTVLGDESLRERLGAGGRRGVEEQFNAEHMWQQIGRQLRVDCDGGVASSASSVNP